jgi:hypothetical protein
MQKMQILFPEPLMRRLRDAARREDRPISEIVRRAVETWLQRHGAGHDVRSDKHVPIFHGGRIGVSASELRRSAYEDRQKRC